MKYPRTLIAGAIILLIVVPLVLWGIAVATAPVTHSRGVACG